VVTVNPRHWLNEDGSFPEEPRLRKQALRVAQCIEYGGPLKRGQSRETLLACQRRPGGKACLGLLWVLKQNDDAIHAFCVGCQSDEYLIYEWQDTDWADGPMEPIDVAAKARERAKTTKPRVVGDDELLQRALDLVGSELEPAQVRRLVAESDQPSAVVRAVLASARRPTQQSELERLMPVIMNVWNSTPRDELGGLSPTQMGGTKRPASVPPLSARVGRNDPCTCGSGRKYKKCCLLKAPN
jgi:hypothetical protein